MWFKNLLIYRFTKAFAHDPLALDELLASKGFVPCGNQASFSQGWVAPTGGEHSALTHIANGYILFCLQRQEKILPAAVINEFLDEKIQHIKEAEDRTPGRKERADLKDEVIFQLLPQAFSRTSRHYGYIDTHRGLLIINSSAHKQAENFINTLRETLGSLPVVPIKAKNQAEHSMTHWLKSASAPEGFSLGGECELRDSGEESAVVRCKNQDLCSAEINSHVLAGMYVNKLALNWQGGIECIVDNQLGIKRVKFTDMILEKCQDTEAETAAERFDADFALMTGEFANFIPALLAAFGGEDSEGAAPAPLAA